MNNNPATLDSRSTDSLTNTVRAQLAATFSLSEAELFERDLNLAEIIAAVPALVNSVDFMECCAKVANGLRKQYGVAVKVPATSLDTRISVIVDSFVSQISSATEVQS